MSGTETALSDYVEATVNYLTPPPHKPVNYAITPPPGVARRGGDPDARRVRIHNARKLSPKPSLDRNGFEIHRHRSEVSDYADEAALRNVYYREAEALLKAATGASRVVVFDHTRRYALPGHSEPGIRETADRVHNDQTFISGPRRVRDHLPADEAERYLQGRHAIINFWRPIGSRVRTWPLALCDAGSIDGADLVPTDLVYADKIGETYSFLHNARHRWFYFPELEPEEVLLLKIYDSLTDGTARFTAHTAFADPTSAPDAPHRRSIELRTLVFWDS